jgi:superfamily I DNA/RNA helicase
MTHAQPVGGRAPGRIVLTTYHSAKGREFGVVVLPGLVDKHIPYYCWSGLPERGGWREEQLASLAARISEQAAMRDGRTNLPAPLHLAKSADEKHPRFGDQEGLNDY